MPLARRLADQAGAGASGLAYLRPIDSEHSAIWQCLAGERRQDVARLILTASGGPFRDWPADRLKTVTPADALAHPTWRMGAKITVDSATLMNKALEVIEARWLYDVGDDQVDVVVHPQSIVHSLVEFADGSLKAQLGLPDMRIPIQYALTYPAHLPSPAPRLAGADIPTLTFEPVDVSRFPALGHRPGGWPSGPTRERCPDRRRRRRGRALPGRLAQLPGHRRPVRRGCQPIWRWPSPGRSTSSRT